MPDRRDIEHDLAALRSDDRPLPPALRDRIEAALLAETAHPLEADLHDRLTDALTDPGALLAGIDDPRPLPASVRAGLEDALATPARGAHRWVGVAAAIVLVTGVAAAAMQFGRHESGTVVAHAPRDATTTFTTTVEGSATGGQAPGVAASRPRPASGRGSGGATSGAVAAFSQAAGQYGPPPPFSFPQDFAALGAAPVNGATTTTRPVQSAVTVAVIGGDPAQEAGFRAYVRRLNDAGGAGGHRFVLTAADASHPARTATVTVNLSGAAVATDSGAPSWTGGPLLETMAAPESVLKNDVFGFASAPERQAHLIADTLVPPGSSGKAVVIYRMTTGLFSDRVPAAMADVVQRNGGRAVMVAYDGTATSVLVPADVALLSLDGPSAQAWFRQARSGSYRPPDGVGAIYPVFDTALLSDIASGTKIESPYSTSSDTYEAAVLRTDTNRPLSSALIHGWVTAKTLAVAVWERDADTRPALKAALAGLDGFSDAWTPQYGVRAGTHSRTPEGIVLEATNGGFTPRGGFRKDPY